MTSSCRLSALVIGTVFAVTVPLHARAETATEARFFDDVARRAYGLGHFDRALDAFLVVHSLTPGAASRYNIAVCATLVKKSELAFSFFEQYLQAEDGDQERHRDAERRLGDLRTKLALVEVTTTPPNAELIIDRAELGAWGKSPRTGPVDPGDHVVIANLPGYKAVSSSFRADRGSVRRVEIRLDPILGRLEITTRPERASLFVEKDGSAISVPSDSRSFTLPVGKYHLRIESPDSVPAEADVLVTEQGQSRVDMVARPVPPRTGRLLVDTGKDAARVLIDGKAVAMTPATLAGIVVGRHRVSLHATGKAPWSADVDVTDGKSVYVNATLLPRK